MLKRRSLDLFTAVFVACATLQFIRYYVVSTTFYLNMNQYLSGRERLPFQERVLPIALMWPINHSALVMKHFSHTGGGFDSASAATPEKLAFYVVSLITFSIAGFFTQRLYNVVMPSGRLSFLVFPIFMALTLWSYVIHIDANFSYPYDMPALAFFAAGLHAIYTRRFNTLAALVFVGTFNRETTIFLVGIYVLDAASRDQSNRIHDHQTKTIRFRERFSRNQIDWKRVILLFSLWLVVKLVLVYHFRFNDNSENFTRVWDNVGRLRPRLWPILLNMCGYVLPFVVIFGARIHPIRFGNYLCIVPFWFASMFYAGVILETRVYGELCPYVAVAVVLLLEQAAQKTSSQSDHNELSAGNQIRLSERQVA